MQLYYACIVSHLWSVNHSRPGKNCLDKYNHNLVKTIPLAIAFRFCVRAWNIAVTLQTGTSSPFICQDLTSSFQTAQSVDSFQRTLIANICSLDFNRFQSKLSLMRCRASLWTFKWGICILFCWEEATFVKCWRRPISTSEQRGQERKEKRKQSTILVTHLTTPS